MFTILICFVGFIKSRREKNASGYPVIAYSSDYEFYPPLPLRVSHAMRALKTELGAYAPKDSRAERGNDKRGQYLSATAARLVLPNWGLVPPKIPDKSRE
jgi:hypothetical protein